MHRLTRSAVMLVALFSVVSTLGQARTISDEFLMEYASMEYDKAAHGEKRQSLGLLNGIEVLVDFVCSDICPDYTVRIIHFNVEPGADCTEVGGIERTVIVPVHIAAAPKPFCFPKVLSDNWDAYIR